jgi:hypothetical protein
MLLVEGLGVITIRRFFPSLSMVSVTVEGCWSEVEERLADNGGVFVVKMGMEAKERSGGDSTMVERRSNW